MYCSRCKTVELIRIEHLPMNLLAPWECMPDPVDRCPCCGLEWHVTLSKMPQEVMGRIGRGKGLTAAEYLQRKNLHQVDLFTPIVGGFALNDLSEP